MSKSWVAWVESLATITYLIVMWVLVIKMIQQRQHLPPHTHSYASYFIWAFTLLSLGDAGHVGFRLWSYALGGLDTYIQILGQNISLVGIGRLTTSITLTIFYMLMLVIWRKYFNKPYGWFGVTLFMAGILRFGLMAMPQNNWNSANSSWPWSLYRNLPFILQGLGVAYLILRDAISAHNRTFIQLGGLILASYAFYIPVVLLVHQIPAIGALMLPKTLTYAVITWVAYARLFKATTPISA